MVAEGLGLDGGERCCISARVLGYHIGGQSRRSCRGRKMRHAASADFGGSRYLACEGEGLRLANATGREMALTVFVIGLLKSEANLL